jgi:tetratricopeptide (TPR) repeat protein
MAAVIPHKANIAASDDFDGLELTGHLFGFGSQYVIAVAMFISGDRATAIEVLRDLNKKLKVAKLPREWPGSKAIISLVPKRLLDFQFGEIDHEYFQWRADHEQERLRLIATRFAQLPESWKKDSRYLNIRAICHFVLNNNVVAARELIRKVGSISPESVVWRYSLAFLEAYEGKMLEARASYLRAFRFDSTSEIALEVEEFLCWIAETHANQKHMHFFLGFINFHKKKDYGSAETDFRKFLATDSAKSHPQLTDECQVLINECIDRKLEDLRSTPVSITETHNKYSGSASN